MGRVLGEQCLTNCLTCCLAFASFVVTLLLLWLLDGEPAASSSTQQHMLSLVMGLQTIKGSFFTAIGPTMTNSSSVMAILLSSLGNRARELAQKVDQLNGQHRVLINQATQLEHHLENTLESMDQYGPHKEKNLWLVIGIPTIARYENENYLSHTLESIARDLPTEPAHPMYGKVLVVVMTSTQGHDEVFENTRAHWAKSPKSDYFWFWHNDNQFEKSANLNVDEELDDNTPGARVQKQSRDVARLLKYVSDLKHIKAKHYLFMEDDFFACNNWLLALQYIIGKADTYYGSYGWVSLRVGYGLNGVVFSRWADVAVFSRYLLKHYTRRPPDHLLVEWFLGETPESQQHKSGRTAAAYRFNLFDHLGVVSSVREAFQRTDWPACHQPLADALFDTEAFDKVECGNDDLSPCGGVRGRPIVINFDPNALTTVEEKSHALELLAL